MKKTISQNPLITMALLLLVLGLVVVFLIQAKAFLLPLALGALLAFFVRSTSHGLQSIFLQIGVRVKKWISMVLSFCVIFLVSWFLASVAKDQITSLVVGLPEYSEAFDASKASIEMYLGDQVFVGYQERLAAVAGDLVKLLADFAGKGALIVVYAIFILIERNSVKAKLEYLLSKRKTSTPASGIVDNVTGKVLTYFKTKTITSLLTAALSGVVFLAFGLPFTALWVLLIFVLNYIPAVGSIVAVALPVVFSVAVFGFAPAVLILLGLLLLIQFLVGSILDPQISGDALDLSPLVVFMSLMAGGAIWGPIGILLAVPALIMMTAFAGTVESLSWFEVLVRAQKKKSQKKK